jgi:hypothetical protein
MPTDIATLIDNAKCIETCIPTGMQLPVLIALFAQIAGTSTDPATLVDNARCIETCIPPGMQLPVIISLLDQIVSTPAPCVIPDAPVLTGFGTANTDILLTWTAAQDPNQDFMFYWSYNIGGPFTHSQVLAKNLRAATFDGGVGIFGAPIYGLLVARNSNDCVSANSNIFTLPVLA